MKVVSCNGCGWVGAETEMTILHHCPSCNRYEEVYEVDHACDFSQFELVQLWELFGDIPIDDEDCIDDDFIGFEKGTYRFDIWKWFDQNFEGGVVKLQEAAE